MMSSTRALSRSSRAVLRSARPFSAYAPRFQDFEKFNKRGNDTREEHRKHKLERPLNPHLSNTTSTNVKEMPSIGRDGPPPDMISSVDPKATPKDAVPENTEKMTGGTQPGDGVDKAGGGPEELGVGELEGASFKVAPLRRTGEDANTMRARLLCMFLSFFISELTFTVLNTH